MARRIHPTILSSFLLFFVALGALPAQGARVRHHPRPYHHPAPPRVVAATPAPPANPYWPKLYLGAGVVASALTDTYDFSDLDEQGVGLDLYAGVRFSPALALELGWMGLQHETKAAGMDEVLFQAGTLDLKVFLGKPGPVELFISGGGGIYGFSSGTTGESLVGGGLQGGAGLDLHLSPGVTLSAQGEYHVARIDDATEYTLPRTEAALRFVEGSLRLRLDF